MEGNKNIDGITELISNYGSFLSQPNNTGVNIDGLNYDRQDNTTSQPLSLTNFSAVGTNIQGLNFNQTLLTGSNFSQAFTTFDANNTNETFFQNIVTNKLVENSSSISFRDAVLEGLMNFEDADLEYADFTNAKITHPQTTFSTLKFDGRDIVVPSNYNKYRW